LILQKAKSIAGKSPIILTGDLNGDHDSEWYKSLAQSELIKDTFTLVQNPYANNGSFNGFGSTLEQKAIIDHIFISNHFQATKWGILTDTYHGKFPSDHFPVVTQIDFK
jgi:endonuclease/exonuclease/phosphatase family metal-dependent hydrolase